MSDDETRMTSITAKIVDKKSNKEIATVERTLSIMNRSEEELPIMKTLDEIVTEFIQKVQETVTSKKANIIDADKVYDDIVIGFIVSSKTQGEQPKVAVIVPVEIEEGEAKDGK